MSSAAAGSAGMVDCPTCGTPFRVHLTRGHCPVCGWSTPAQPGRWRLPWRGQFDVVIVATVTVVNLVLLGVLVVVLSRA
ncbi:MAG TPA: hypothetical protein VNV65_08650 [Candidatus Solibacter sp.]|nr:hypothetical protein [Candidatus Solibacter sp.]